VIPLVQKNVGDTARPAKDPRWGPAKNIFVRKLDFRVFFVVGWDSIFFGHHHGSMASGFCSFVFFNCDCCSTRKLPLALAFWVWFFCEMFLFGRILCEMTWLSSGIPSLQTTCIPCEVLLYGSPAREAPKRNWSLWVWRIAGNKTMAMEWKITWVFFYSKE